MIRFTTLGTVGLRDGRGSAVDAVLSQPTPLAVLAYLAAARPGPGHGRDTLCGLLWGEASQDRARASLNQALYVLRKALGQDVIVSRGRDSLEVDAECIACDARSFREALASGDAATALDLYGGDFLSGFYLPATPDWERWVEAERGHLRALAAEAAWVVGLAGMEAGSVGDGLAGFRRSLALGRLREGDIRDQMSRLGDVGEAAAALRLYEALESALRSSLDTAPSPETASLAASLRRAPRPAGPLRAAHGTSRPAPQPGPAQRVPSKRRGSTARTGVVVGLFGLAVAAVAAVLIALGPEPPPGAAEQRFLVIPPVPMARDTSLERLGGDLARLLAWRLDGVGDLRAAGIAAPWDPSVAPGAYAAETARLHGARTVIRGVLVPEAAGARLELVVEDEAAPRSLETTLTVDPDALVESADSIAWAVLRLLWRDRPPPAPNPGAIGSPALPALRAYLDGEAALLSGDFRGAQRAFRLAIEADSTFWFAYWRYIQSRYEAPVDSTTWAVVRAHYRSFPERDRALVAATLEPSLPDRIAALEATTQAHPYYWPAWWEYGNALVHHGPLVGYAAPDALAALDRALSLNPRLYPAWEHTFWLSAKTGDAETAEHALRQAARVRGGPLPPGVPDVHVLYDFVAEIVETRGAPSSEAVQGVADYVVAFAPAGGEVFFDHVLSYGYPRTEIDLATRIRRATSAAGLRKAQLLTIASAWAARGAWDSALVTLDTLLARHPEPGTALEGLRLATAGVWIGGLPASAPDRFRAAVERAAPRLSEPETAEVAWLSGLAAALEGDERGIDRERLRLTEMGHPIATELERSLRGFQLALDGEELRAARLLRRLETDRATRLAGSERPLVDPPFLTAVNRLSAAQWFIKHGRSSDALPLLVWTERVPRTPLRRSGMADATFAAVAKLQRARAESELRLGRAARRHYGEFLTTYDVPARGHATWVDDARAARARLAADSAKTAPEAGLSEPAPSEPPP